MIGLTGTYEAVKSACKAYRVYFSTPPNAKATDDYLVDHSILYVHSFAAFPLQEERKSENRADSIE